MESRAPRAGLLSLGPAALVSHRAATAVHGFERADPGAVEFTVPVGARGVKCPFVVHTTAFLGRADAVTVGGLRVTSATRTIIDLARLRVPDGELTGAIDTAVRLSLSSLVVLAERLGELRGPDAGAAGGSTRCSSTPAGTPSSSDASSAWSGGPASRARAPRSCTVPAAGPRDGRRGVRRAHAHRPTHRGGWTPR